jgi:two-component system cell cycle sensor histidine kinase/response regulator CckA
MAGQVAGQVAHDFNNMLGPIIAYPELIREGLSEGDHRIKYLQTIEHSAQKMADLNQQLLTLSRRGHYNQEVLNLNELVNHVLREMALSPSTLVIETELAADLMNVKGGAAQLYRAIMNILVNARDALQDIGKISIKTENYYVEDTTVIYGRVPQGEYAKVTITDTGCGIPDEIVQKIFDPFFTTKPADKKRGSGLGLSVVDAVVKDHDGYLDLSTALGVGTSFYLYFPITRAFSKEIFQDEIVRGTETILVVDDDEIQRDVSAGLLTTPGYKVTVCESGKRAVEMLKNSPYDLLILDMVMPNGIDGAETYRQALQIRSDQRAIILSGFSESDRVTEAQRLGVGVFVKKPTNRKAIAQAVRHELDRTVETFACV